MEEGAEAIPSPIVWIDLEMTGLDVEKDKIMEIAVIVTDSSLEKVKKGPDIVIHVDDESLDDMDEWCTKHHGDSGLTQACRESLVDVTSAEQICLDFIKQYCSFQGAPLAGNSIYTDRFFIKKYMPELDKFLHYRLIDVSSIHELLVRWNPRMLKKKPRKKNNHRALDDIVESIEELKFYRKKVFKIY